MLTLSSMSIASRAGGGAAVRAFAHAVAPSPAIVSRRGAAGDGIPAWRAGERSRSALRSSVPLRAAMTGGRRAPTEQ
jgi:hypothetical protein